MNKIFNLTYLLGIVHKLRSRWGGGPPPHVVDYGKIGRGPPPRSRLRYDYGNGGVPPQTQH